MNIIKNIVKKQQCNCCTSVESKSVQLVNVLSDIENEINRDNRDNPQKRDEKKIDVLYRILTGVLMGEDISKVILHIASYTCRSEYIIEEENDTTKQN